MDYSRGKKSYTLKYYFVIFISLLIYALFDMQSSQVTGNAANSRSSTHIALIVLILLHFLSFIFYVLRSGKLRVTNFQISILCITLWILTLDIFKGVNLWLMLTHCGLSALWFLSAYFYSEYRSRSAYIIEKIQTSLFLLLIIYSIAILYYMIQMYITRGRLLVSNLSYNLLVIFPWLLIKSDGYSFKHIKLSTAIVSVFIIISLKRGAIIAFILMFLFYMIVEGRKQNKQTSYFIKLIISAVAISAVAIIVDNYLEGALFSRFTLAELQTGSGRNTMYEKVINSLRQRNIKDLVVGIGSGGSSQLLGTGAHNEWLEFIYSFGLIGVLLYFLLIISMVKQVIAKSRMRDEIYIPLAMSLIYVIAVGMYGGIYFMQSTYFVFALFGFSNAKEGV